MTTIGAFCVTLHKDECINSLMPGKCATCVEICPYGVFSLNGNHEVVVKNYNACVGCRLCAEFCPENAIRINPAESELVSRFPWTLGTIEEIHHKALTGGYMLRGFGTMGQTPHFDSIVVVPSQLASPAPRDKYREECNLEVVIGEDTSDKPIRLQYPFIFPAMSYGALSREAKLALAIAAANTGIITNTGEGGVVEEEPYYAKGYEKPNTSRKRWEPGGYLVIQWSTGRWGVSADYVNAGDAVEIKIGQGAKPGMGGHLLGEKVTEDIAAIRGIPVGSDALSPCRYYDVLDPEDIKKQVEFLRDITNYEKPIMMKLGPSRPYQDVRAAALAGVDAISIDGLVGGTGCSPEVVTQGVGIPTIACIGPAVRALQDLGLHRKVKLFALGGIRGGLDAYKAMAMGADGVGFGTAAEIAMGCRGCMACHQGNCPYGITSQSPKMRERLDPEEIGQRLTNFIKASAEEVKILTMLSGHNDVGDLSEEDLRALDVDTAAITGLKLVGYERPLPWWQDGGGN
jgi:glutamate synthase domain-containing protein 2/NAD-dependent dihydropyrimidine dehydrogenase PreA subunit